MTAKSPRDSKRRGRSDLLGSPGKVFPVHTDHSNGGLQFPCCFYKGIFEDIEHLVHFGAGNDEGRR